jgi:hypothetical protein
MKDQLPDEDCHLLSMLCQAFVWLWTSGRSLSASLMSMALRLELEWTWGILRLPD